MSDGSSDPMTGARRPSSPVNRHAPHTILRPGVELPTELYETMSYVHFLHMLAVNPDSVLPPGKSLLSVLSKPHLQDGAQATDLHKRVETIVHEAFWDEALESLLSPTASVQILRLKLLYNDIHTELLRLLPEDHPVLTALSLPFPPTSFPLRSALGTLKDVLHALRARCAPIHDPHIKSLLSSLDGPLDVDLPQLVLHVTRDILQLCARMREDLAQFVLGTMSEDQLYAAVVGEAAARERQVVQGVWGADAAQVWWRRWLDELSLPVETGSEEMAVRERFIRRLVQALSVNAAVSCDLSHSSVTSIADGSGGSHREPPQDAAPNNFLPPALFFVTPTLLYTQNYLQALVIAAALRALVRLPAPLAANPSVTEDQSERSFEERVWILLKTEIDEEPATDGTKLINLADEVVRAAAAVASGGSLDNAEETRLRAAVDRTLQPGDPVFLLLQKRLMQAVVTRLTGSSSAPERRDSPSPAPRYMQSGRNVPGTRRLLRNRQFDRGAAASEERESKLVVKGFDHPIMVAALAEMLATLQGCIEWTESVWSDLIVSPVC